MKRYFAYGSNMDKQQMRERCPQSKEIEKAELIGYEFFINARGVANVRQKEGGKVLGIVYEISEEDEKELNSREGVQYGTNIQVHSPELDAFYYVAKETADGSPREGYLEKIIDACQEADFPSGYVQEIKSWQK